MSGHALILMYHRVCERGPRTACWFARGTAVTPETLARQLALLRERVRFVTLDAALEEVASGGGPDPRPACALTFDDGYHDVLDAVPSGLPLTVFAVADVVEGGKTLWFDRYYDILHRARRRSPRPADLGLEGDTCVPPIDADLRWWVRGPEKERLQCLSPDARTAYLDRLERDLDAAPARDDARYLSRDDLRELVRAGHRVGGHGRTHSRLTALPDPEIEAEFAASRALVDSAGPQPVRLFSYPDGATDQRVARAAAAHGFTAACGVQDGVLSPGFDPLFIPRRLMREDRSPEALCAIGMPAGKAP